jgi:hypothetical protein
MPKERVNVDSPYTGTESYAEPGQAAVDRLDFGIIV